MPTSVATGIRLLPFFCPFDEAIHPAADEIEARCVEWLDRFRLYGSDEQRERLIATKAAQIYSRALPDADPERVADVAKWLYWGFATDDLVYDNGPVSVSPRDFLALAVRLVRICEEPRAQFDWEPPYADALRDLARAILRHATPQQRLDWAHTARAWFFGMAWDVGNAERGTPPALNDYLMMRMHTGGLHSWVTTLCIANGVELEPCVAADSAVLAATEAFSTLALLLNDLMSYAKETRNRDTSSNIVNVLAHERECSPPEAVPEVYAIADRIANLFLALRAQLLTQADEALRTYLAGMEHTWRGILDWGFRTARYVRGGDLGAPLAQTFPGWAREPTGTSLEPLPYPSISWWWEEIDSTQIGEH